MYRNSMSIGGFKKLRGREKTGVNKPDQKQTKHNF